MNDAARKLAEAFVALAKALSGVENVVISTDREPSRVTIWMKTDAAALRLAGLFDIPLAKRPWGASAYRLQGDGGTASIGLSIIGVTDSATEPLDDKKVDAALAKADEALAEVHS